MHSKISEFLDWASLSRDFKFSEISNYFSLFDYLSGVSEFLRDDALKIFQNLLDWSFLILYDLGDLSFFRFRDSSEAHS